MRDMKVSPKKIQQMMYSIRLSDLMRKDCLDLPTDGRRAKYCLCPFHREKTPSMVVNDDWGTFRCYGCGAQGDHLDFLYYKHYATPSISFFPNAIGRRHFPTKRKAFMACVRKLSQITGISLKGNQAYRPCKIN